jgi:NAD(P)-dependent dehydrogenase (short-subunit alcohol dehydrogenase family)
VIRTAVVTGAAYGIGTATVRYIRERAIRVMTSDLRDADVIADLATADGRASFVEGVTRLSGGTLDAVVANAGGGPPETSVQLNFFGAVPTLQRLRSLLERSVAPRAVAVSSIAALGASRTDLQDACLAQDETAALSIARTIWDDPATSSADAPERGLALYGYAKLALNRWCRHVAPSRQWAGAGILLNIVAPGFYDTPSAGQVVFADGGFECLARGSSP